jgi:hypothetical protein
VWLVRQGPLRFALPITSGTKPGVADYLPAPHGLPGFVAPVEQIFPAGASYFELPDGRVLAATDGADDIKPGADGRSLTATWRRFALIGGKTGNLVEPGFTVSIAWRIDGATLTRTETISADHDVAIRRLFFLLSSTATKYVNAASAIQLSGPEGVLDATTGGSLRLRSTIRRFGDEPLGRGPRVPIPTHVSYESNVIQLRAGQPQNWVLGLKASAPIKAGK